MPNLQIMCSWMKLATAGPVAFFREMASTHFVKYSVATNIMTLGWWIDRTYQIEPPSMEWPRSYHVLEVVGVIVYKIPMDWASMACLHTFSCILFHGGPEIPKIEQLLEKSSFALMVTTLSCVYLLHNQLCFVDP